VVYQLLWQLTWQQLGKTWFLLTTWTIPPPLPPFSAITSVVSSSTGATTQEAILITALTAEFFLPAPPEPNAAWAAKAAAFEVLFAAAIRSAGVDIIGIGLAPVFPPVIFTRGCYPLECLVHATIICTI